MSEIGRENAIWNEFCPYCSARLSIPDPTPYLYVNGYDGIECELIDIKCNYCKSEILLDFTVKCTFTVKVLGINNFFKDKNNEK